VKIYSNILTLADVRQAFKTARDVHGADIYMEEAREWKPRGYAHGVEVWAESMHGKRATGHVPARSPGPRDGYPRAASWDDWGFVIASLFNQDPHARVGFYDNEADFVKQVRQHPHAGSDLAFLNTLTNIGEY
jgi:hypothetical protein